MPHRKARILAAVCLVASALTPFFGWSAPARAATGSSISISPHAFTPGAPWADTSGNLIQGHNGSIILVGSTYYWIGQDVSLSTDRHSVACYSSTDLVHWRPLGDILTDATQSSVTNWPSTYLIGPVKVLQNSKGLFVLWASIVTDKPGSRTVASYKVDVATSSQVCGSNAHYKWIGENGDPQPFQPQGKHQSSQPSGDIGLFEDSDGSAYLLSEDRGTSMTDPNRGLYIYALTSDFTGIDTTVADNGVVEQFTADHEAPAMFKDGRTYYVFGSGLTGWAPNDNEYTTITVNSASSPLPVDSPNWSKWAALVATPPGGPDPLTCVSQTMDVLQVQGASETSYIYIGDRWDFPDLYDAGYVWLPITFSGSTPKIDCSVSDWYVNTLLGQTGTLSDGFTFTNTGSGKVMEEPSGSPLDVASNDGLADQQWEIVNAGVLPTTESSYTPYYMIENVSTGEVLESSSGAQSGLIAAAPSTSGTTQQEQEWAFVSVVNPSTGKLEGLTLQNSSTGLVVAQASDGTLDQEMPTSANNQMWALSQAPGYWAVTNVGNVDNEAGTPWFGSLANDSLTDIVGIVPTPDGGGYWLFESDGHVTFFGDVNRTTEFNPAPTCSIVGATADPASKSDAYWAVDSCGTVWTNGVQSYGSATGSGVHIVAMAATHDGLGYWLVDQNGTVYPFGDAGSSSFTLCKPCTVVSAITDPVGGFWALTNTGAVLPGGNAPSLGDESGSGKSDFTTMAATADGGGYWLFEQDHATGAVTVYPFGNATAGTTITGTRTLVAAVGEPDF